MTRAPIVRGQRGRSGEDESHGTNMPRPPMTRHVVQISEEAYNKLRHVSTRTGKPMSTILAYLIGAHTEAELVRRIKEADPRGPRRGAPAKRYFED